jgi:SAM-dependent methyltransferase
MKLPRIGQSIEAAQAILAQWFLSPLGQELLVLEQRLLLGVLPDLFGYHAVQLGQITPHGLLNGSRILHKVVLDKQPQLLEGVSVLAALPQQLPFANDSIDLVLVHHLLEVAYRPQAILREAARVVIPEGHLLIVGFNQWSLWGLWYFCRMPWSSLPYIPHSLSVRRLHDWLNLLGFEIVGVETCYFGPPIKQHKLRPYFLWLEALGKRYWPQSGGSYVILAQKKTSCITPIRLRPRMMPIVPNALVTESRHNSSNIS